MFAQLIWTPEGRVRFIGFSVAYWILAGAVLMLAPTWLGPSAAALALGYAIWWAGPAAVLAPMYLFGSCFCLGKLLRRESDNATAILLGLSGWILVIWITLHFPMNTSGVYAVGFAIPYIGLAWQAIASRGLPPTIAHDKKRFVAPLALAAIIFFLSLNLLVSLK